MQAKHAKNGYIKLVKQQPPNLNALNSVKTNGCQPQAERLARTFET